MADSITSKDGIVEKTTRALNGIPFDNLIASPLNACIKAQAQAAATTMAFIDEVGLVSNKKTIDGEEVETKDAVYVYFNYQQGDTIMTLSVPLLTIVPIPYISIDTIDINFTCTVNGIETTERTEEDQNNANKTSNQVQSSSAKYDGKRLDLYRGTTSQFNTSISSKRDSKSTQNSQYSIEATIDVAVHAKTDSMPAGMAKVLEMLHSSIDLVSNEATENSELRKQIEEKDKEIAKLNAQIEAKKS